MTSIYQVSARKFRPKCFSEVLGQPHVIDSLRNSLKNKSFGHAFLFNGPRGVGKTTCARILAQAINCEKSLEIGEPCNECNSCINLKGKNLGGVFELDGASNNSVENIKSIIEKIRYLPTTFKYSIYIIDEVHMLSGAAFNAFLKTLEEPPAHAIFILATTEKSKILPTILSRCQIFDFKPISISNIVKNLKEVAQKQNINYEEEALYIIAEKADGGMRDALSIFDTMMNISLEKILSYELVCKNLGICGIESYVSLVDLCFKKNLEGAIKLFHEIIFLGVESTIFLVELIRHLRNLLIIKNIKNGKNFIKKSDEAIKKISSQAEFVSYDFLDLAIKKSIQCDLNLKNCSDKNLIIELLIFSLASGVYEEKKDLSPPKKVNESKKNKVNTSSSEKTLSDKFELFKNFLKEKNRLADFMMLSIDKKYEKNKIIFMTGDFFKIASIKNLLGDFILFVDKEYQEKNSSIYFNFQDSEKEKISGENLIFTGNNILEKKNGLIAEAISEWSLLDA